MLMHRPLILCLLAARAVSAPAPDACSACLSAACASRGWTFLPPSASAKGQLLSSFLPAIIGTVPEAPRPLPRARRLPPRLPSANAPGAPMRPVPRCAPALTRAAPRSRRRRGPRKDRRRTEARRRAARAGAARCSWCVRGCPRIVRPRTVSHAPASSCRVPCRSGPAERHDVVLEAAGSRRRPAHRCGAPPESDTAATSPPAMQSSPSSSNGRAARPLTPPVPYLTRPPRRAQSPITKWPRRTAQRRPRSSRLPSGLTSPPRWTRPSVRSAPRERRRRDFAARHAIVAKQFERPRRARERFSYRVSRARLVMQSPILKRSRRTARRRPRSSRLPSLPRWTRPSVRPAPAPAEMLFTTARPAHNVRSERHKRSEGISLSVPCRLDHSVRSFDQSCAGSARHWQTPSGRKSSPRGILCSAPCGKRRRWSGSPRCTSSAL